MPRSNTNAPYMMTTSPNASGSSTPTLPTGAVRSFIPTASTTTTLTDGVNGGIITKAGVGSIALRAVQSIRCIDFPNTAQFYNAALASLITGEWSVMGLATVKDAGFVNQAPRFTLGNKRWDINFLSFDGGSIARIEMVAPALTAAGTLGYPINKDVLTAWAIVAKTTGYRMFLDGLLTDSGATGATDMTGALGNAVGYNYDSSLGAGIGTIGPYYIWNRALTDAEVMSGNRYMKIPPA